MNDRELTVSYSYQGGRCASHGEARVPYLRLRGQWLRAAGFEIGDRVWVRVEQGRLVVQALDGPMGWLVPAGGRLITSAEWEH